MSSEGFENSVRQPILPHELPDIFLAVEFGRAWRELQERDVAWNLEGLGAITMQFRLFRWIRFRLAGPMLKSLCCDTPNRRIRLGWLSFQPEKGDISFGLCDTRENTQNGGGRLRKQEKPCRHTPERRDGVLLHQCACLGQYVCFGNLFLSDGSISPAFGQTPQWVPCFEFPTRI